MLSFKRFYGSRSLNLLRHHLPGVNQGAYTTTTTTSFSRGYATAVNNNKPASFKALSESFIDGSSASYVEDMYTSWQSNPSSVHASWDSYFKSVDKGASPGTAYMSPPTLKSAVPASSSASTPSSSLPSGGDALQKITDSMRIVLLVRAYQVRGHVMASLDPLKMSDHAEPAELKPERYGFTEADMDREISLGDNMIAGFLSDNSKTTTLRHLIQRLREAYCGKIGVEFMHIQERDKCDWIRERFETKTKFSYPTKDRLKILERLTWAELFETFLATKWVGAKRFGLDGCESLIPGMKALIDTATLNGVNSIVFGMPHRGRLNVLANVLRKPLVQIFNEFHGNYVPVEGEYSPSGDVKYHLGTSHDRVTTCGKKVHLSLVANPSHLEAVNPVVEGKVRAKQFYANDDEHKSQVLAVVLHGDAAFAGQGVVYETLHLSELKNYSTGGTVHIIVNNQVGFTTDPKSSRSSLYPTDVAKALNAPIFHVNGDDPEAVVHVHQLAAEWRQTFHTDVVVDIVCYRRNGHNEGDEPSFTQPLMYKTIRATDSILKQYSKQLVEEKIISSDDFAKLSAEVKAAYQEGYEKGRDYKPANNEWLESHWKNFKGPEQLSKIKDTGVPLATLQKLGKTLTLQNNFPEGFTIHKTLQKLFKDKTAMFEPNGRLDWATAEALAFGSLLLEGNHVRLSGQDVERGTFSHRHSVLHDQENGQTYTPLSKLDPKQAAYTVTNSSLSEFAVLGFELGYSLENPNSLILWEAQFGDFANGAQVIIDQFISSGEMKWKRQSGLTMLLPHGYDGQGPEHSSARLERFLTLCDSDPKKVFPKEDSGSKQLQQANWAIVNCTTPANYFHVLRRQVHREFRKPLVVFSSKWLLRYGPSFSPLEDLSDAPGTGFRRLIPEAAPTTLVAPEKITRVIFCSGQVYYILAEARKNKAVKDVAIIRVEQLYPFPFDLVTEQAKLYPNADYLWCQEEPMNMGAWNFVQPHLVTALSGTSRPNPSYAGRPVSASPAVASGKLHALQQERFVADALKLKK